jgi:hypothetical protein
MQLMPTQDVRPKPSRLHLTAAICCGLLPYLGGLLVTLTRQIGLLAVAGVAIAAISTSGAYFLRKSADAVTAKQRLMIDPLLYGSEFVLTAVLIRFVFMR